MPRSAPPAPRWSTRASWPSTRKARTRRAPRTRTKAAACRDWSRAKWCRCTTSRPTSTSPSRRRASPRPAWSRRWRNTASAVRRPMPASSRCCSTANTCCSIAAASSRPTSVARSASSLSQHFTQYVDYDFTAKLEDELDAVSRGEEAWVPLMERFWQPFKKLVDEKTESVDRSEATGARELGTDPKSGKPVSVRLGRYGPYAQIGTKDRRGKAAVRQPAPRPEHAHDHAGGGDGAVQAAAQAGPGREAKRSASASAASARS